MKIAVHYAKRTPTIVKQGLVLTPNRLFHIGMIGSSFCGTTMPELSLLSFLLFSLMSKSGKKKCVFWSEDFLHVIIKAGFVNAQLTFIIVVDSCISRLG